MKVIYVAGKYRSSTPWGVRQNIETAARVAAEVWRLGFVALCPHLNSAHMEGVASDELFLAGTLELMRRCDGVLTVPGWEESVGARAEVDEAIRKSMPIFHDIDQMVWYFSIERNESILRASAIAGSDEDEDEGANQGAGLADTDADGLLDESADEAQGDDHPHAHECTANSADPCDRCRDLDKMADDTPEGAAASWRVATFGPEAMVTMAEDDIGNEIEAPLWKVVETLVDIAGEFPEGSIDLTEPSTIAEASDAAE